jgi:hypothetical protein
MQISDPRDYSDAISFPLLPGLPRQLSCSPPNRYEALINGWSAWHVKKDVTTHHPRYLPDLVLLGLHGKLVTVQTSLACPPNSQTWPMPQLAPRPLRLPISQPSPAPHNLTYRQFLCNGSTIRRGTGHSPQVSFQLSKLPSRT